MTRVQTAFLGVLLAALVLVVALPLAGCKSAGERDGDAEMAQPAEGRGGQADTMAGSDAERAKSVMEKDSGDADYERPASPRDRERRRVVDQPRGTGQR